jgi:hypothetical protein
MSFASNLTGGCTADCFLSLDRARSLNRAHFLLERKLREERDLEEGRGTPEKMDGQVRYACAERVLSLRRITEALVKCRALAVQEVCT